jgi:SulP family sulfate permease
MKHMSEEAEVRGWVYYIPDEDDDPDSTNLKTVPLAVRVYEISGPMFFGAADRIAAITLKDFTKVLIIRMRGVPELDATAMHSLEGLYAKCAASGVAMVFSHVNERPMRMMRKAGFIDKLGEDNFCAHIDAALARAEELLGEEK